MTIRRMNPSRSRRLFGALLVAIPCLLAGSTWAADDPRYAAIGELGRLNGIALQCRYIEQVRRMKEAIVLNAPKERSFGLAFDEATNRSFLAFIREDQACPSESALARDVGHGIDVLRDAFRKP